MGRRGWSGLGFVAASGIAWAISQSAFAETLQREVRSGQKIGLFPVFGYVGSTCATYPAKEITITIQPEHGRASIEKHELDLASALPQCRKKVTVPWVAYQPTSRYVGRDRVSVSYSVPGNTGEMTFRFVTVDVEISVK